MPTFDFKCKKCSHVFSKLVSIGVKEEKCVKCGAPAKKLLSAPAVHFKGEGFYSSSSSKDKKIKN